MSIMIVWLQAKIILLHKLINKWNVGILIIIFTLIEDRRYTMDKDALIGTFENICYYGESF